MKDTIQKHIKIVIPIILILLLTSCRHRLHSESPTQDTETIPPTVYETPPPYKPEEPPPEDTIPPETPPPTQTQEAPPTPDQPPPEEIEDEPEQETHIEAETDSLSPLSMEIEYEDAHQYATQEGETEDTSQGTQTAYEEAADTITIEIPAEPEEEGQAVLGDDGGVVGIVADYTTLLRQGVNTLFPCQLLYIYTEIPQDLTTVARDSDIYRLMASAGGINASTRLTPDRLTVDADWVVRRNPDIIVKFVAENILGSSITTTGPATDLRAAISSRENWNQIEAIRTNSIILLSTQMLESDEARLAAKLLISRMMYPELFANMDVDTLVAELLRGMDGIHILL